MPDSPAPEEARGTLYVVATPIGNLEDVTLRALRILGEVRLIACEDTRRTRKLLSRHDIHTPVLSCHEHNEERRVARILEVLAEGGDVALVSDAGSPVLSDPGRAVVRSVVAAGGRVVPIPGPSAVVAALMAAGEPGDGFVFLGFPPRRGAEREKFVEEATRSPRTVVFFEAPHRIARTLAELAEEAPDRLASVHREMTKVHEEILRGTLLYLSTRLAAGEPRGEFTVVVEGSGEPLGATGGGDLDAAVRDARRLHAEGRSASQAAREAARRHGVARRLVYARVERAGAANGEAEEE